jgi:YggT family protein
MFVPGYLILAIAMVVKMALGLFFWLVIARVILSWVNPNPYNDFIRQIIRAIYTVTDPVLYRIRAMIPLNFGGIDFSPIVVILAIQFLQIFLVRSLMEIAQRLIN